MTASLEAAARWIARHFAVVAETAFTEDGRAQRAPSTRDALTLLERRIYLRCHLRTERLPERDESADERLRRTLWMGVGARVSVQDGWELVGRRGEYARVRKDGLTLKVNAREVCSAPGVAPGDLVGVRFPAGRPYALPGWFVYISRHGQPSAREALWRVYVNVRAERAEQALSRMSCWLEARGARFQLKLLDSSQIASRPDALVAFVHAADVEAATVCAARMGRAGWLEAATPGFAAPVAPGIAFAPERSTGPHDARSYGQACARAAAQASFDAWRRGARSAHARAVLIAERLEAETAGTPALVAEEAA